MDSSRIRGIVDDLANISSRLAFCVNGNKYQIWDVEEDEAIESFDTLKEVQIFIRGLILEKEGY